MKTNPTHRHRNLLPAALGTGRAGRRLKQNIPLLIMFMPVALFFIIFKYVPMLGIVIAFKDYNLFDGIWRSPWVGMDNFRNLFQFPDTLNIIRNTLLLSLGGILVGFPLPVILAVLLNEMRKAWYKRTIQTFVYLPHFLNWVIIGGIVVTVFSQESGFINSLIRTFGGEAVAFLYKPGWWVTIFLGSGVWKEMGFSAIIYLAALTSIDPTLYEASSIDGANKWRQMWHITLPGLVPTMILMLILAMGRVMEVGFDPVYNLQNRVVSDVAEVISTYIYKNGIQSGNFSLTTALGLFESAVGLVMVLTTNWIARKYDKGLW